MTVLVRKAEGESRLQLPPHLEEPRDSLAYCFRAAASVATTS